MLVISSSTLPHYSKLRTIWRMYMKSHPDVDCYFVERSRWITQVGNDTIFIQGRESYETIIGKTTKAIRLLLYTKPYTHVVRTNLSSVWNFPRFLEWLETQPQTQFYAGKSVRYSDHLTFASGCGMTMSADVADVLVRACSFDSHPVPDDVVIGECMRQNDIPLQDQPRTDFVSIADYESRFTNFLHFHVRVRQREKRDDEPYLMLRVYERLKTDL